MSFDPASLFQGFKTALQIVVAFSAMIFIHELGHFTLLKFFKVKVHEFSLGFVGQIVGFKWGGTLYKIAWIPFGGYVKPEGEFSENEDDPIPPHSLLALPWWKKALVYLAGPSMNLVGAVIVLSVAMTLGVKIPLHDPIVDVEPGTAAFRAALQTGDRILAVDGTEVSSFQDVESLLAGHTLSLGGRGEGEGEKKDLPVEALEAPAKVHVLKVQRDGKVLERKISAEARIGGLRPEGPADKAGLKPGDVIVQIGGKKIPSEMGAVAALRELFGKEKTAEYPPIQMKVLRNKETLSVSVSPEWNAAAARPLIGVEISGRVGIEPLIPAVVGSAKIGFPAREAGIKPGDKILSIDDKKLFTFSDLEKAISERGGKKTRVRVERDGKTHDVVLEPIDIEGAGRIGITPPEATRFTKEGISFWKIPGTAVAMTYAMASDMLRGLWMLFSGKLPLKQSLSGPLTIGRMMKQEAQAGWSDFLQLIAALNIMLGVINLLPIPVVDGGEITFCLVEGALRRKIKVKTYMFFKQAGFALLMGLMVFVMWNDVAKLLKEWLRPQIL